MTTDTGRTYGFEDIITRGGDYGPIGRKRKTYDRDIDLDEGRRGTRFGFGADRGYGGTQLDRGTDRYGGYGGTQFDRGIDRYGGFGGYFPFDYGTTGYDYGLGPGTYQDVGYPSTFYSGRYGFQQPPQAIGEAGFDLGLSGRRADDRKYRNLRDWPRVEENPNIDELTLWRPRADIFDQGAGGLRVEFEIPGVPKEDISLTVRDDVVTLTALKPQSRKEEAGFHYQNERHFGKFYRRLALPFAVDPNSVRAYLELGVLKVHLWRADGTERIPITEERVPIGAPGAGTTGGATSTGSSTGAASTAGTTTATSART